MTHKTLTERLKNASTDAVIRNMDRLTSANINNILRIDLEGNLSNHEHPSSPRYRALNIYEPEVDPAPYLQALNHPAIAGEQIGVLCAEDTNDYINTTSELQLRLIGNQLLREHALNLGRTDNNHFQNNPDSLHAQLYAHSNRNINMLRALIPKDVEQLPEVTHPSYQ